MCEGMVCRDDVREFMASSDRSLFDPVFQMVGMEGEVAKIVGTAHSNYGDV